MNVAVLTVSDRSARGERDDESGPVVERLAQEAGWSIVARGIVPDEQERITETIASWCNEADLVLTTGGTGLAPRDVTPEATRALIDREVPGIAEAMRARGLESTAYAALSRQVAGTRGRTLIVNLPGSPKAAAESLQAVLEILPHAVESLREH